MTSSLIYFRLHPKKKSYSHLCWGMHQKSTEDSWSDGWGLLNTFFINFQRPALALESRLDLSNIFVGNKKSTLYGDTFYRHIGNNFQTDNFGSHIVKSFYFLTTEGTFCVLAPDLWRKIGAWFGSEKYSLCRNLTNCAKDLRNRISHFFTLFISSIHHHYQSSISFLSPGPLPLFSKWQPVSRFFSFILKWQCHVWFLSFGPFFSTGKKPTKI